jgi:hypothetical protein
MAQLVVQVVVVQQMERLLELVVQEHQIKVTQVVTEQSLVVLQKAVVVVQMQ